MKKGNLATIKEIKAEDLSFKLTDDQLQILDEEHDLHLSGKNKSYNRLEANKIIKEKEIPLIY